MFDQLTEILALPENSRRLLSRKRIEILRHYENNCHGLLHSPPDRLYQEYQSVLLHHLVQPEN